MLSAYEILVIIIAAVLKLLLIFKLVKSKCTFKLRNPFYRQETIANINLEFQVKGNNGDNSNSNNDNSNSISEEKVLEKITGSREPSMRIPKLPSLD